MEIFPVDFFVLALAALFAGLVDAAVGGGGLIQVPALFGVFPQSTPAVLFGTNKLSGIWGTAFAAVTYAKKTRVEWGVAIPASLSALLLSLLGAWTVSSFPAELVRNALPVILLLVAVYVFRRKDFGVTHAPLHSGGRQTSAALLLGAVIGFYDGFFGPGTGSFLIFLFVRFFGFDFLGASAVAKIVNVACNLSALALFGYQGQVLWQLGLLMAVCNVAGAVIGARLALLKGNGFIRRAFLVVVSLLILKTTNDAFLT